jgi:catechol 2,3-dioxygenase-like lactoylglutathione lyase family enzyme
MEDEMKRFHVHVAVKDLEQSKRFYSAVFGVEPTVVKPDYAKWMLDDPRVNFAISQRNHATLGVNHLGMQAETDEELEGIHANLQKAADSGVVAEKGVQCCYATSDKYWVTDPQGIAWESFRSLGTVPFYGEGTQAPSPATDETRTCCGPTASVRRETSTSCCSKV